MTRIVNNTYLNTDFNRRKGKNRDNALTLIKMIATYEVMKQRIRQYELQTGMKRLGMEEEAGY